MNDTKYSNCNMDCSYHAQPGAFVITNTPRVGPTADFGNARMLSGVATTFRLTAGTSSATAVVTGDKVFLAPSCGVGPAASHEANRTAKLDITREAGSFSALVQLPAITTPSALLLRWCFSTTEMGASPSASDYSSLPDTLTVIAAPTLAAGIAVTAITGTSPDFEVSPASGSELAGADGGDHFFFRDLSMGLGCDTIPQASSNSTSLPVRAVQYDDAVLGPGCGLGQATLVQDAAYAASTQWPGCGDVRTSAMLGSDTAWCSAVTWAGQGSENGAHLLSNDVGGPYLQLDAGLVIHVAAIKTQGYPTNMAWVTKYSVSTSKDGLSWVTVNDTGTLKIFSGNLDSTGEKVTWIGDAVLARYVRVYPKAWQGGSIAMRAALLGCPAIVTVALPSQPALAAVDGSTPRALQVCFATRRSEALEYTLVGNITVVPEPTDPVQVALSVREGAIFSLPFVGPAGYPGKEGDMIVLKEGSCDHMVSTQAMQTAAGPSGIIVLETDGAFTAQAFSAARVNELDSGQYKMCYATRASMGDHDTDWNSLGSVLDIINFQRSPVLSVPSEVNLGNDIFAHWQSNNGLDQLLSQEGDWLGLYREGECPQVVWDAVIEPTGAQAMQNKCYISTANLPVGQAAGSVIFPFSDIKTAGRYEVRYFRGDSQSGQGYVCRGVEGGSLTDYTVCALEAATHSTVIEVRPTPGANSLQRDGSTIPGLEYSHLM